MEISSHQETITPEIAQQVLLKYNASNYRKISRSRVKMYADDMKAGKWQMNGEPIIFDEDGMLKDGQHRLAAVVMSGVPLETMVVRGVSKENDIYDSGLQRTSGQIAKANGLDLPPQCITTAKIVVNRFKSAPRGVEVDYMKKNSAELSRAYRLCCLGNRVMCKRASLVAATYLMIRTNSIRSYEAELFFKIFNSGDTTGTDGYDPSPALTAKEMFDERFSRQTSSMAVREQLEIIILAMEDFHKCVHRKKKYKIAQPFHYEKLIDMVREKDGLPE